MTEVIKSDTNLGMGKKKETMVTKNGEIEIEGIKGSGRWSLVTYEELPGYMKDNEYILRYYRADWPLKQACRSLFQWHNETINIWT